MKLLLFKILLLSKTREQGFTLPLVIGIGLIMVLLGSMSLVQSSEEQLNAIYTTQASTSLAIAELGVARYRELLNNNRTLAVHDLARWTDADVEAQTCTDITGAWSDIDNWFDINLNEAVLVADINGDGDQTDINTIGRAKIVNYDYQNDSIDANNDGVLDHSDEDGYLDQTSDAANLVDPDDSGPLTAPTEGPRGILTVQAQEPNSNSVTQVEVTIPIGVNTNDLETLDPGIWIYQDGASTNWGDINLNSGNLVVYRETTIDPNQFKCNDLDIAMTAPLPTVTATRDPRNIPPLTALEFPTDTADYNILPSTIAADEEVLIGKPSATSFEANDGVERYYYRVNGGLIINEGASLITDGTAKVVIFVDGDLTINSNTGVGKEINISNSSDAATSRYLQIHVNGNVEINGDGIVNIKGLVHAPGDNVNTGKVSINGSATVNLTGSIWADNWANAGRVNVDSSEYQYYSITPNRTPKPLTYPPTGWEQQQAN